jgi:hypothetical protein
VTALLYLAIIALWMIFLIPWIGRHRDATNGRRSAARYRRAMAVLSRRHAGPAELVPVAEHEDEAITQGYVDDYRDPWGAALQRSLGSFASLAPKLQGASGRGPAAPAAVRRRRILLGLAAALLASVLGVGVGVLPWWVAAVAGVLLASYCGLLVAMRGAGASSAPSGLDAGELRARTIAAQRAADGLLAPRGAAGAAAGSAAAAAAGGLWAPVDTSLPGKVVQPGAGESHSGAAMVARAQQQRADQERAQARFERDMAALQPDPAVLEEEIADLAQFHAHGQREVRRDVRRRAANE